MFKKFIMCCVAGALCFGGTSAMSAEKFHVEMAPSGVGTVWYVGLGAFAKLVSEQYPEISTSLFPGTGVANFIRVGQNQSQLAIGQLSVMKAANDGLAPFTKKQDLRAIANLNDPTTMTFMVPPDSEIKSLYDVARKKMGIRVDYGSRVGGIAELFMNWLMEEYGVTKKALRSWGGKVIAVSSTESTPMLQDDLIDLEYSLVAGSEGYKFLEVLKTKDMRFLDVDADMRAKLVKKYGLREVSIPATHYYGKVGREVKTLGDFTGLVVNKDMPDEVAYKLAKVFVESREDIIRAVPGWKTYTKDNICKDLPIQLHPGAEKYYREAGLLK